MQRPCESAVMKNNYGSPTYALYSTVGNAPPSIMHPNTRRWIVRREEIVTQWYTERDEWSKNYYRSACCGKYTGNAPVEITQYDSISDPV